MIAFSSLVKYHFVENCPEQLSQGAMRGLPKGPAAAAIKACLMTLYVLTPRSPSLDLPSHSHLY